MRITERKYFDTYKKSIGKEIEEIEDLIEAYGFAQNNKLNEKNLLNCHKIFSDTLLIRNKWEFRDCLAGIPS